MKESQPITRLVVWLSTAFLIGLALLGVAGCGGRSDEGGMFVSDASAGHAGDASGSGGAGGTADSGAPPVNPDAHADVGVAPDARIRADASVDAMPDARADAPSTPDAGRDAGPDAAPPKIVSIAITPPTVTLVIGTNQDFKVTGAYSNQTTADLTASAVLTSSDSSIASVAGARVTALRAGTATITAVASGLTSKANVVVSASSVTITSIAVTPANATTGVHGTVTFTAVALLSDGNHQDVTTSATFSSSAGLVAAMTGNVARGLAAGTTSIQAKIGTITGQASLTVTPSPLKSIAIDVTNPQWPIGYDHQFQATASYEDGSIADVSSTVVWTTSNAAVLRLTASGSGTTLAQGASVVTATLGSVAATTTVTVVGLKVTAITVSPSATKLNIKGTVSLRANGTLSNGTPVELTTSVVWTTSNPSVASVSNAEGSQGLVTGLSSSSTPVTITATFAQGSGAVSATAQVSIVSAKLQSIAITPGAPSVPKGATVPLVAMGTYDDNTQVDLTTQVTWTTDAAAIAIVSNAAGSNGQLTGVAKGATTVRAVISGITASASITVTDAALSSIDIQPKDSSLVAGLRQNMTATGIYSDQSQIDLTTTAVWTTGDAAVASINNASPAQGLLTATGAGSTSVTATYQGVSGTTQVTVTEPATDQLVISPNPATARVGENVIFTATAILNNGSSRTVQATWSSSDTAIATIGRGGRASAVAAGTTTVTATYNRLTATVLLTVTAAVPSSISVSPANPTLNTGVAQNFSAQLIYTDSTSKDITGQATWVSTDSSVATVTPNGRNAGRVTAVAAGTTEIRATYQGLTGTSTVSVADAVITSISVSPPAPSVAIGTVTRFTAAAIYNNGTSRDVTGQATWQSSDNTVAAVSNANTTRGQATAIAPGAVTIRASYQGVEGTASLTVSPAAVRSIQLTPATPSVPVGIPIHMTASAVLEDGTTEDVTSQASWTSSAAATAAVSDAQGSRGLVTPLSVGSATVQATWSGKSGVATVTVTGALLKEIQVTPFAQTLPIGFVTTFQATGLYDDNTTQDLTSLATWTSTAPAVASVSDSGGAKGTVTPLTPGTATLTATFQSKSGTDQIAVTSATLTAVTVTPATPSTTVGGSVAFSAVGSFSDASTMDVTRFVTWLTSNASVAGVSNALGTQGVARAFAVGSVTVTATRNVNGAPVSGTTTLTVTQ